jgi:hypothetical protein
MAKKARKKAKKAKNASTGSGGRSFSMKSLHAKLDETLDRLKSEKKTKRRDELIGLVKGLRASTECDQNMLIELGI